MKSICETPGEIINLQNYKKSNNGGVIIVDLMLKIVISTQSFIENTKINAIEFDVKQ